MRLPLALYPLQTSFFHLPSANAVNRMEYTYSMVFSKWCGKFMQWFCYVRVVLLQRMPFNVHAKIYMNSEKTRAAKKKNKQIRNLWMKTHKNAAAFFLLFRRLLFACSKMERWNESGFFSPNFLLVVFMLSLCVCVCMSFIVIVERTMKIMVELDSMNLFIFFFFTTPFR